MTEEDKNEPLAPRKAWGDIPFQPRILPLEVTASAMEGKQMIWQTCTRERLLQGLDAGHCYLEHFDPAVYPHLYTLAKTRIVLSMFLKLAYNGKLACGM